MFHNIQFGILLLFVKYSTYKQQSTWWYICKSGHVVVKHARLFWRFLWATYCNYINNRTSHYKVQKSIAVLLSDLFYISEHKCQFGQLELRVGDKLSSTSNTCMECGCDMPPLVSCTQKTPTECTEWSAHSLL